MKSCKSGGLILSARFLWPVFILLLLTAGCSHHYADNLAKPIQIAAQPAQVSLEDSLIGSWKISKIDAPDMMAKMTAFGTQEERETLTQKVNMYEGNFRDLSVTFDKDHSFKSSYNGMTNAGTWKLTSDLLIQTVDKFNEGANTFQLVSINGRVLTVTYTDASVTLKMVFERQ